MLACRPYDFEGEFWIINIAVDAAEASQQEAGIGSLRPHVQ